MWEPESSLSTFEQAYIYFTYFLIDIKLWSMCVCGTSVFSFSASAASGSEEAERSSHTHRGNPWFILTVHQLIQSTVCSTTVLLKHSARTTLWHIAFQKESKDKPSMRAFIFLCLRKQKGKLFFLSVLVFFVVVVSNCPFSPRYVFNTT